jgi:hypothetical protein
MKDLDQNSVEDTLKYETDDSAEIMEILSLEMLPDIDVSELKWHELDPGAVYNIFTMKDLDQNSIEDTLKYELDDIAIMEIMAEEVSADFEGELDYYELEY